MYQTEITGTPEQANCLFPPAWVRVALALAPLSIWVVITLFTHLKRTTRKPCFDLWTVAWAFCSMSLAAIHCAPVQDAVKEIARLRAFYRLRKESEVHLPVWQEETIERAGLRQAGTAMATCA
jgi:hypothetical protein